MLLVEGQTEEQFVKQVLGPHADERLGLQVVPVIVKTKRAGSDPAHKGGYVTFEKLSRQINNLLGDTSADLVSTMLDYFRIGEDYPGVQSNPGKNSLSRAMHIESSITQAIKNHRFRAYIQIHEFESLLFSQTEAIANKFALTGSPEHQHIVKSLDEAWATYATPEEINTGQNSHPFARIRRATSSYKKMIDGPQIANAIGIPRITDRCNHFREWVEGLRN